MKVTRHSLLAKGIMVLLSLLVLVFAFTYSWFRDPSAPVTASGLTLKATPASTDFSYAVGFSTSETGYHYFHTAFTNETSQDLNLEKLVIDTDDQNFSQYDGREINILHDYTPIDVTGNGVTLIRPAMNYGNWDIKTSSDNYSVAEPNVQYISFDLIFRTETKDTVIKLDAGSFAKGNCETYAGDGKLLQAENYALVDPTNPTGPTENISNFNKQDEKSGAANKYGTFSRDGIVGAVRVAFLEYTDLGLSGDQIVNEDQVQFNATPKLLWIPRPDLYLDNGNHDTSSNNISNDLSTTGWTLQTNVTQLQNLVSKAQINHSYDTYKHQYYNIFDQSAQNQKEIVTYEGAIASQLDTGAAANTNKVTFAQQHPIVTLSVINDANHDNVPDDGYYYGKVRVRIWIEGTDSESRRAMAGGKFSVGFHITG